ncbi:cysteine--tRNA ligase [Candidatus Gottesmanbacteria bacterium]|nr:cysteine--tRNA ligase [Candidatus Gottesmanbacteria bacterium]
MLRLYNTLTRKIENFVPLNPPLVTYYSCGPTVYDFAHIGHARTYVFSDILQRVLEWSGYKVKRVMNITDVGHLTSDSDTGEDKMEKGAKREGKTVWDIAKFYTDDFFVMLQKLNIKTPQTICKATDYIKEMIDLVKVLEKKGFTYTIEDGVYFDTGKISDYGKLTGKSKEELEKGQKAGFRVEIVPGKRNPMDFALWKLTPKGVKRQMEWDSPWGKGFPGWHIECSAMSMKVLGPTIDIHTGGVDHIPIHHTNEIAQSEAATDKKFVRFFLHGEHLFVDGEKMSKSRGNFYRVADIEKKEYSPLALRYLFLTVHYRTQMNFTWKSLNASQTALTNLYDHIRKHIQNGAKEGKLSKEAQKVKKEFEEAISSDLSLPLALAVVWDTVKGRLSSSDIYTLLLQFDTVLGLGFSDIHVSIAPDIQALILKRDEARRNKNFQEADKLRSMLEKKRFAVNDTSVGTIVIPRNNNAKR